MSICLYDEHHHICNYALFFGLCNAHALLPWSSIWVQSGWYGQHILILNNLTCHITGVNGSTTLYEIPAYLYLYTFVYSHAQGNKKEGMSKWVTQWIGSRPVYMHDILHYSMQKRELISHYNQANAHTITYHHFQSGHVSDIIWGGSKNKANSHMGIPSEKNKWSTTHKSHLYTFLLLQRSSCRDSTSIVFFLLPT